LAEVVRLDRAHHRPVAADSDTGEAIKVTARTHQSLIWDRTRHVLRLRSTLRERFPVALQAFEDLDAPEALELLARAPEPDLAARLSIATITAALRRARRRHVEDRATALREVLRAPQLQQSPALQAAYAAVTVSEVAIIATLNTQIERLGAVVGEHFGRHRDAETYTSLPGLGVILAARILGEFGDPPTATQTQRLARTTPAPHRSPVPLAPRKWSWPATHATAASGTPSNSGRSARYADHLEPPPTTSSSTPATSATKPRSARSPTASSVSSTAA
jgi:transposase